MTHPSIQAAIGQSEQLARIRSGEDMIPPPNYDIALTLYEREADGSDTDNPFLSMGTRPQDFATNPHMKYQHFGVIKSFERDGKTYGAAYLVHLYWDGNRDADSAVQLVLSHSSVLGYGQWEPTAPSDPLKPDDFWNHETLGDPPNGWWDGYLSNDDSFVPFNNFAREPYEKVDFSKKRRL